MHDFLQIMVLWYFHKCTTEDTGSTFHAVDLLRDMLFLAGGAGLRSKEFSSTRASRGSAGSAELSTVTNFRIMCLIPLV